MIGEYEAILSYISEKQLTISPYIQINLAFYKMNTDNYSFYYSKNGEKYSVFVSVYHNTVQLWADEDADYCELREFLNNHHFEVLFATIEVLKKLFNDYNKPGFIL